MHIYESNEKLGMEITISVIDNVWYDGLFVDRDLRYQGTYLAVHILYCNLSELA